MVIIFVLAALAAVVVAAAMYIIPKVIKAYVRLWISEESLNDSVIEGIIIAFGIVGSLVWAIYDIYHL